MVSQRQPKTTSHSKGAIGGHQNNKRKRQSGRQSVSKNKSVVIDEEQLDRFAGSSEEEGADNDNEEYDDASHDGNGDISNDSSRKGNEDGPFRSDKPMQGLKVDLDDDDDDDDDGDDDHESEIDSNSENETSDEVSNDIVDDEDKATSGIQITSGLANAMSRILSGGTSAQKSTKASGTSSSTVILSKTKTPLQIQAAKEKKIQESLKESRRLNRERKLKALHIPLTVATSMAVSTSSDIPSHNSLAAELEAERTHRRVATRGVVALFNAIAQHQTHPDQTATAAAAASEGDSVKQATVASTTKLTKHGFLDLIKQKAVASSSRTANSTAMAEIPLTVAGSKSQLSTPKNGSSTKKWNALKDDFLIDSGKNWDEVDSD